MAMTETYKKEIINLTKDMPINKLKELVDFAGFLKTKEEGFAYAGVKDSVKYVKKHRSEEGGKSKSAGKFIEELIKWQKSNC